MVSTSWQPVSRYASDRETQSVFSAVLAAAQREGYASASPRGDTAAPLDQQAATTWQHWFASQRQTGRYQDLEGADQLGQAYGELLVRAVDEGAYANPQAFLKGLSADDLKVVQTIQRLAAPIDVSRLDEEGSLNLLLPPAAQIDLNHDGLTRSGVAWGLRFPSSTTPPEVVMAWDKATENLSDGERMTYEFQMMMPLLTRNIEVDSQGKFVRRYEPGDPGYTNPMASDDYSYIGQTGDWLRYLDAFKYQFTPEQYASQTAFWTELHEALIENGAK